MKNNIELLPCAARLEGIKDGQLKFLICNCKEHHKFKRQVIEDTCNQCLLREGANQLEDRIVVSSPSHGRPRIMSDGVITYPKRGWEPPSIPAGYRRKTENLKSADAWIFIPILPECQHRPQEIEHGHCGACKITYFCTKGPERIRIHDLSTCGKCLGL